MSEDSNTALSNSASVKKSWFPFRGALIGLDYGTKRMGIAVCNFDQTVAVGVETWNVRSTDQNLKHLRHLIDEYRGVGFVVGLPVRLNGVEGEQSVLVRKFGDWLSKQTNIPVAYWDERHSSNEAEVLLWSQGISPEKAKDRLDRLAAQIILQSFLDAPDRTLVPQPLET